jgi:hypothetical protein
MQHKALMVQGVRQVEKTMGQKVNMTASGIQQTSSGQAWQQVCT